MDASGFTKMLDLVRWSGLVTAAFVIAGAYLLLRFLSTTVQRLSVRFSHRRLLLQNGETFLRFIVYIVTAMAVIAASFKLDGNLITVMGGTVIFTVGFALKDLAAAVLAGMTILIDRPFQVGDRVAFGGAYGQITAIGLRSVKLQTLDDNTVTIPNNRFLTEAASSGNYGALEMQIPCDFYIGVDQDLELAQRLVEEAVLSSRYVFLGRPVVVHVNQVIFERHFAIRLRARGYVLDVVYEEDYATDVNRRVLRAFRDHGILPPAILMREAPPPAARRAAGAMSS